MNLGQTTTLASEFFESFDKETNVFRDDVIIEAVELNKVDMFNAQMNRVGRRRQNQFIVSFANIGIEIINMIGALILT